MSVGTLAALGWSVVQLLRGAAGAVLLGVAAAATVVALLGRCAHDRVRAPDAPADRVAAIALPLAGALATATLGFWLAAGAAPDAALGAAVTVLVVGCPGAAALAVPAALLRNRRRAARAGVGLGGPDVAVTAARLDTAVLRGAALTGGAPVLDAIHVDEGVRPDDVLRLAGAVAAADDHPLSRALDAAAVARFGAPPGAAEFDSYPGLGARGIVAEVTGDTVVAHAVLVGRTALLAAHDIALPAGLAAARDTAEAAGHAAVAVAWDGIARGVLVVADPVPAAHTAAVGGLRTLGLTPVLVTARPSGAAHGIAARAGIAARDVVADTPAGHTADVVRALRARGRAVAALGLDGAAAAAADLAVGSGPDGHGLRPAGPGLPAAVDALRLARHGGRTARAALAAAYAPAVAALPFAAAGLLPPAGALAAGAAGAAGALLVAARPARAGRRGGAPAPRQEGRDATGTRHAEPATAR